MECLAGHQTPEVFGEKITVKCLVGPHMPEAFRAKDHFGMNGQQLLTILF